MFKYYLDGKNFMSYKNKSILVTGGAGFIGSHFVDLLLKNEVEKVIVVDNLFLGNEKNLEYAKNEENFTFVKGNIVDYELMNKLFRNNSIDICFNFAVIPLPASLTRPNWTFIENVKQVANLSQLLYEGAFETLMQISSSEAYGSAQKIPMDEEHILIPKTPYAASKAAGDHLVMSYFYTFGLDIAILRPFNNYGPRQNDKRYAGVIPTTIKRIINGEKPVITGDGSQTRDYIFVKDTVEAIYRAYKTPKSRGEIINISSNSEVSIKEIIEKICKYMNYKGEIEYIPKRIGDVDRHRGDNTKCKRILNFEPKTSFDEGIQITIESYLNKRSDKLF